MSSVTVILCATAKEDKQQLMSFATQFREVFFFLVITTAHALQGNSRDLPEGMLRVYMGRIGEEINKKICSLVRP